MDRCIEIKEDAAVIVRQIRGSLTEIMVAAGPCIVDEDVGCATANPLDDGIHAVGKREIGGNHLKPVRRHRGNALRVPTR